LVVNARLSFTLGSFLIMASFMMLKGWKQQLQHMTTAGRLPFTVGARA
jgi:nitrogen fixation protein